MLRWSACIPFYNHTHVSLSPNPSSLPPTAFLSHTGTLSCDQAFAECLKGNLPQFGEIMWDILVDYPKGGSECKYCCHNQILGQCLPLRNLISASSLLDKVSTHQERVMASRSFISGAPLATLKASYCDSYTITIYIQAQQHDTGCTLSMYLHVSTVGQSSTIP